MVTGGSGANGLSFFPEKFRSSKLFATMYFRKGQMVCSFLGDKFTTSPVQGTSEIPTECSHTAKAHMKIIR